MLPDEGVSTSCRCRFILPGIRLTSMARRDDGYRSGRLILANSLSPRCSIIRNASRSRNRFPMTARTVESAAYADSSSLRFTVGTDATARRRRRASSSRTGLKDWTRRALSSSTVQILRIYRHPSP